jgi:hypothetical protein
MHGRVDLLDQLFWHIALGPRAASATKRFKCSSATTLIGGAASRKVLAIERNRTHQMVFLNGNSETFVFGGSWENGGGLAGNTSFISARAPFSIPLPRADRAREHVR